MAKIVIQIMAIIVLGSVGVVSGGRIDKQSGLQNLGPTLDPAFEAEGTVSGISASYLDILAVSNPGQGNATTTFSTGGYTFGTAASTDAATIATAGQSQSSSTVAAEASGEVNATGSSYQLNESAGFGETGFGSTFLRLSKFLLNKN